MQLAHGIQSILPETAKRVARHTPAHVNRRIRQQSERNIEYYQNHTTKIEERLDELDREWDVERAIEAWSSGLTIAGLSMAIGVSRKWLALPVIVQLFLMQHALQGWCPPVAVLRRLGVRTAREIENERHELLRIRSRSESNSGSTPRFVSNEKSRSR